MAVPRATPGVRVGAIAASGLAALPFGVFLPGLVAGNAVFVGGHFALGYAIGPTASDLIAGGSAVAAGLVAFVSLGWLGLQAGSTTQTMVARIFTFYYFAFFITMPIWTRMDAVKPVPERVTTHD